MRIVSDSHVPSVAANHTIEIVSSDGRRESLSFDGRTAVRTHHTSHGFATWIRFFNDTDDYLLGIPEAIPQVAQREGHLTCTGEQQDRDYRQDYLDVVFQMD